MHPIVSWGEWKLYLQKSKITPPIYKKAHEKTTSGSFLINYHLWAQMTISPSFYGIYTLESLHLNLMISLYEIIISDTYYEPLLTLFSGTRWIMASVFTT